VLLDGPDRAAARDVKRHRLDVELTAAELKRRLRGWKIPKPHYTWGVLAKYARLVSSASEGAVTG
jgi:dihydroxy-acid dehydratase